MHISNIFRNFARFLWHLMKNEFKQQNNDNEKIADEERQYEVIDMIKYESIEGLYMEDVIDALGG